MTVGENVFTSVTDPNERDRLFKDLCSAPCEVLGKLHSASAEPTLLKAEVYSGADVSFRVLDPQVSFPEKGELVLQITFGNEKYLCSSSFHYRDRTIYIRTTAPLYRLQRRADFRLKMPAGFQANFEIKMINQMPGLKKLKIIDLSGGGCRLNNDAISPILKVGDLVSGEIVLADRPRILIIAEILYVVGTDARKSQSLGLKFMDVSPPMRNRLSALVMDLYRQLFSKLT